MNGNTEIADSLTALGFNCLAIDQRSGGSVNGVTNETKVRATAAGKGTDFIIVEIEFDPEIPAYIFSKASLKK